jgi:hypothetical protein
MAMVKATAPNGGRQRRSLDAASPEKGNIPMKKPVIYQIRIKGHLGPQWSEWFDRMTIFLDTDGTTTLSGPVVDQAALHGLLVRVRDLGLELISVSQAGPDQERPDAET